MKIALLGYGRMGKEIEKIAISRGHEIVIKKNEESASVDLTKADVAIDFSIPSSAYQNIIDCFNHQIPVISGTTGWLDKYQDAVSVCKAKKGAFIYASNFSVGVNLFFELNQKLAEVMHKIDGYNISMEEIHHTNKLDAPSGTAITLAEGIIEYTEMENWELDTKSTDKTIPITAKRIPNVPGTHSVFYDSEVDRIEIKHTAHSRKGFALGAVVAAEWIIGKQGVYSMKDVLNLT